MPVVLTAGRSVVAAASILHKWFIPFSKHRTVNVMLAGNAPREYFFSPEEYFPSAQSSPFYCGPVTNARFRSGIMGKPRLFHAVRRKHPYSVYTTPPSYLHPSGWCRLHARLYLKPSLFPIGYSPWADPAILRASHSDTPRVCKRITRIFQFLAQARLTHPSLTRSLCSSTCKDTCVGKILPVHITA